MTLNECIQRADDLKPNGYSRHDKTVWISNLDMIVFNEIIATHKDAEIDSFGGYTDETEHSTVLLVPPPYDEVYLSYIAAQIDAANNEFDLYNNDMIRFNEQYSRFRNEYNSRHMPYGVRFRYF